MKKSLGLLLFLGVTAIIVSLLPRHASSFVPTVWYLRNDGGSTSRCTGQTNAPDPGSGTAQPCAYSNPINAISAASCGDTIKALAGDTFDTTGLLLTNKSCSVSDPITITSTATLPNRRVSPADASLMPRFRTTSTLGNGVFVTDINAGWWVLDGLEITDNAGILGINFLIDLAATNAGAHDITVKRNWIHQKETGTNYERSVIRALQFEGSRLTYTQNYVDIIGSPYGTNAPHDSVSFLCVTCHGVTMTDNYSNTWWNGFFTGGGDTGPQHTATLTSGTTTSATFSSVTSLSTGMIIRFSVTGTATLSNAGGSCAGFGLSPGNCPTLTQVTGDPWVTADGNENGNYGDSVLITSVADPTKFGITRFQVLTGSVFTTTIASSSAAAVPNGAITYTLYQTAMVTNIAGSVITYDPNAPFHGINYSTNSLNHPPVAAGWNAGDEGVVTDIDVESNTFNIDIPYAIYVFNARASCPKGAFELKCARRFTFKYNQIVGYPGVLAITTANQNGTSPWSVVDPVDIESNWIHPDSGYPECTRQAILIADDAYLNTITPTNQVTITNNLAVGGVRAFLDIKNGNIWTVTHNTSLNGAGSTNGPNALMSAQATGIPALTFTDNIGDVVCYGIQHYADGFYVTPVINHNVLIDTSVCSGGINVNTFGTNSALSPIPTLYSQVGFTSLVSGGIAGSILSLTPASNYYHQGNGGVDPGINWNTPLAPWLTNLSGTTVTGKVTISGKTVVH